MFPVAIYGNFIHEHCTSKQRKLFGDSCSHVAIISF